MTRVRRTERLTVSQPVLVVNESTRVSDKDVQRVIPALQAQISEHFAPIWRSDATLSYVQGKPPLGHWVVGIFDNNDKAGAAGYHDLTPDGLPLGKVFAGTTIDTGGHWTVTLSHETLEMLGDPGINMSVQQADNVSFFAYEACDPCEDDQFGYSIDGVMLSDFVFPEWFGGVTGSQYDYNKKIDFAGELLANGYIGVWTAGKGWTQKTGILTKGDTRHRPQVGSRRERRRIGRGAWVRSTYR
jgi:hypothetical protein